LLDDMAGFAKQSQTTGGLGGALLTVTAAGDGPPPSGSPAPAGALRSVVEQARKAGGGWIVFSPALGDHPRIDLNRTLRLPSNVTLDGGCGGATITATAPYTILSIGDGVSNVVVTRLNLEQRPPVVAEQGDCITVAHDFDRVWIAHNSLKACGDGLIDIVQNEPGPAARITVAFNKFSDHDKDMGIGNCPATINPDHTCDNVSAMPWSWSRGLQVTLQQNLFAGTGGRHPRVAGLSYVHMVGNLVAFARALRSTGRYGIAYGVYVGGGARLLSEGDLFLPLGAGEDDKRAIFSAETPGVSANGKDGPGAMRLVGSIALAGGRVDQRRPELVPPPPYELKADLDFRGDPWKAVSCLAGRVGPRAAVADPAQCQ
jgi:pectate lyase